MNRTDQEIRAILATFRRPDRARYPELAGYTADELYQDLVGGGGLYLAAHMARTLDLQPSARVLDLGCGKGATSVFLAKQFGVQVTALDLWTSVEFLDRKFTDLGWRDRIEPLQMDATQPLPFADGYFDAIFSMNACRRRQVAASTAAACSS